MNYFTNDSEKYLSYYNKLIALYGESNVLFVCGNLPEFTHFCNEYGIELALNSVIESLNETQETPVNICFKSFWN